MQQPADLEEVRASYDRVADAYGDLAVGRLDDEPWLRAVLDAFAEDVAGLGPVLDVGDEDVAGLGPVLDVGDEDVAGLGPSWTSVTRTSPASARPGRR